MRLTERRFSRRKVAAIAVGTESAGVGGFTANISVSNLGDPLTAWTLTFTLPSGQSLTQGWSANWTSSGTAITGTNLSYNGSLGTGASTSVGFNRRWTGAYSSPTAFTLNGVTCKALADAPLSGSWFSAQFQQLMENAYPPL